MDDQHFDDLVKRLTQTRLSRVAALRGVLASAVVGLTGATRADATAAKPKGDAAGKQGGKKGKGKEQRDVQAQAPAKVTLCHKGRTLEVAPAALPGHLKHGDTQGPCGDTTPDTVTCATLLPNGKSAAPCAKGLTCCNTLCVPTDRDPGNCGACDNVCRPPQICEKGRCQVRLGGACLPPDADLQGAIDATGAAPGNITPTLTLCAGRFRAVNLIVSAANAPLGLNLVGAGSGKTILDGQGQGAVLKVQGEATDVGLVFLNLTGVTVTGSGGGLGGLINAADILNGGPLPYLTLSDVEVSGNAGSGVVNEGSLGLYAGSRITNNTNATFNGGGIYTANVGGGVGVSADSRIDHNTAVEGGGIFLGAGTVVLKSASSVHDNSPNNCATQDPTKTIPNCTN
jgi:hypothetical protein